MKNVQKCRGRETVYCAEFEIFLSKLVSKYL